MDPQTIYSILQVARFGIETVQLYNSGDITDEEVEARWARIQDRIDDANDLWEQAGK